MNTKIRALVMDVDGTLTDGQLYISSQGEVFKSFNVKDGYGIYSILPRYNIVPIIITGRKSEIIVQRCKELNIVLLYQGVKDKAACLRNILKTYCWHLNDMACIGDDENDIPMMELCGICACPADAVQAVKNKCDYVCKAAGGHGAVREFIEWLMEKNESCGTG